MKVAILRGMSFGKHRRGKSRKGSRKSKARHAKKSGGRAAQRARFKRAAEICKGEVVEQIRHSTGKANPFKMIGACMRVQLRK